MTLDEDFVHLSRFVKTKIIERKKIESPVDILEKAFRIDGKVIIVREDFIEVF